MPTKKEFVKRIENALGKEKKETISPERMNWMIEKMQGREKLKENQPLMMELMKMAMTAQETKDKEKGEIITSIFLMDLFVALLLILEEDKLITIKKAK